MKYDEITEWDKNEIERLYLDGWIPEDIEDEVGIPLEGVYRVLEERGGIKPEDNPFNDEKE